MTAAIDFELDIPRFSPTPLCAETDPDAFYPDKGDKAQMAIAVCTRCPAREECLAYAVDRGLINAWDGVWGGTTPRERRKMRTPVTARRAERDVTIHALFAEGLTRSQISRRLGMSYSAVRTALQQPPPAAPSLPTVA